MFSSNTSQVSNDVNYIEDVFSTYLYTGNGSTQTITNGIDLAGKGGLAWIKIRETNGGEENHRMYDTVRGAQNSLVSNATNATQTQSNSLSSFNSSGFSFNGAYLGTNGSGYKYASWTFRKQPKFFDVVTFTIDGASSNQQVAHNLGSTPGCIFVKASNAAGDWFVYHNATGNNNVLFLNGTQAASAETGAWSTSSTNFGIKSSALFGGGLTGKTAVAYLFAHNAGGFGLSGTDNVISCGSYTGNGSATGPTITLGYEPQWIMVKSSSAASNWIMLDNMRGVPTGGFDSDLYANLTYVGSPTVDFLDFTATGFIAKSNNSETNASGATYIYVAIRRGPMKTPTSGTSVFSPLVVNNSAGTVNTTGFPVDLQIFKDNRAGTGGNKVADRLRGVNTTTTETTRPALVTNSTAAEDSSALSRYWDNTGFQTASPVQNSNLAVWNFRRAPGFFDEVCYTGVYNSGNPRNITHNLGVTPELIIVKCRSTASTNWVSCTKNSSANSVMLVNSTAASSTVNGPGFPSVVDSTSTTFQVREWANMDDVNATGRTYVAYLFASCPGVSKVGSYTGTGTTQQINCGFTAGARFVLIKRTDSTGDWYVWDSARGIVAGNDPYLLLNSTAAEVTSTDYIDTYSAGFEISSTAPAAINASGGTFIYLAIA